MKIIIDAMGGDNAPGEIVKGAAQAAKESGVEIVLVGREAQVRRCLAQCGAANAPGVTVVDASQVVTMADDPSTATRTKKDSSLTVGLTLLHDGGGDAFLSAGSTGALLTGATLIVKRIRGIRRACMAPVMPNGGGGAVLIDCGANAECSEEYLLQFAYMGSFYAKKLLGYENPRVALVNIGAEESKGTSLQKNAFALLRQAGEAGRIRFVGNIEGGEVFFNKADVIVSDGFTGNVMLKTIEGTAKFLMKNLKGVLLSSAKTKLAAALVKKDLDGLKKLLDPSEVGGTPLLGISKPVIKAHGGSDARAIRGAVKQAIAAVNADVAAEIAANIGYMKLKD